MTTENELNRVPPQSLEAEMSLLGSLLLDKDAMLKIADLIRPEDFYKDANARIFETITDLYSRNEPADLLTISTRLEEKGIFSPDYLLQRMKRALEEAPFLERMREKFDRL